MNCISSLRFWLVLVMVGAFSASAGFSSERPPIIPAEDIVQQLSPSAPVPSGRKRKIEFEPAGEESVGTQPAPVSGTVSQRIALPAIEFEFDSDRLTPRARQQVSELAKALSLDALRSLSFAVQGHTDSVGDRGYNRALSSRRASAVKRHLVAERIAAHRLVEIGLGEDFPLPGLARDDGRNRRVEIVHLGTADEVDVPPVAQGDVTPVAQDAGRKALLIGIDAYRNVSPLIGPVNDAEAMRAFITADLGFDAGDVKLLTDADATRANILREIEEWLIGGTRPGDEAFFYFSVSVTQTPYRDLG